MIPGGKRRDPTLTLPAAASPREDMVARLRDTARLLRWDVVRMLGTSGSGHPGGSLSAADVIACLYFHHLRHDPKRPGWPERDRFVLSKGHACPILYAALAECGYFPREQLWTLRRLGSPLQGHPDMRKVPGVEISTGSLGHGFSASCGMALAGLREGAKHQVYVMIGDGESQEGTVWESAMFAGHYRLGNLVGILDNNGLQIDGPVAEVMNVEPIRLKWEAFGWRTLEIDGHDVDQIVEALVEAAAFDRGPLMIVAHTVKGKGISFMENVVDFHGKAPLADQMAAALAEIDPAGEFGP